MARSEIDCAGNVVDMVPVVPPPLGGVTVTEVAWGDDAEIGTGVNERLRRGRGSADQASGGSGDRLISRVLIGKIGCASE